MGSLRGATAVQVNPGVGGLTPDSVANLRVWFQADAFSGLNTNDPIAAWPDLSGQNNHALQTMAVKRPTYITALQAGKPGVRFDQVDDYLETPYVATLTDFTAIVVYRARYTPNRTERLVDKEYSTGFWMGRDGTTADAWGSGISQTSPPYGTFVTLSDASAHVLSVRRAGTAQTVRGDGAASTASATVSGTAMTADPLRLGAANPNLNGNVGADIYEFVLYDRALSDVERAGIELGLGTRWSIAIT